MKDKVVRIILGIITFRKNGQRMISDRCVTVRCEDKAADNICLCKRCYEMFIIENETILSVLAKYEFLYPTKEYAPSAKLISTLLMFNALKKMKDNRIKANVLLANYNIRMYNKWPEKCVVCGKKLIPPYLSCSHCRCSTEKVLLSYPNILECERFIKYINDNKKEPTIENTLEYLMFETLK